MSDSSHFKISVIVKRFHIMVKRMKSDLIVHLPIRMLTLPLLGSLGNIDIIEVDVWKGMTGVTKSNRPIFKMFDVRPPKGIIH